MIRTTLFLAIISLFAMPLFGQKKETAFCEQVEVEVVQLLHPLKVSRKFVYEDECEFSFIVDGNETVALYIQKYETEEESHLALASDFRSFTAYDDEKKPPKHRYQIINKDHYWDEAIAYKNDIPDHFMLLRYQNYTIEILSSNYGFLKKTETLLRNIRFEERRARFHSIQESEKNTRHWDRRWIGKTRQI